jgi:hypothetical protein
MTTETGGSTLLTEGVGTPQGGTPVPASTDATQSPQQQNGNGRPQWLPEKFWREEKPDYEGLGNSYQNLEKLLGGEKVPKPRSDDDEEGWERWYRAAGKPEKPDDYQFQRPNSLPDNFYDEQAEKSFRTWAHVNGLTKKQASNLYDSYVKTQLEARHAYDTSQQQAREEGDRALRREWGDKYEGRIASAKAALKAYGDQDYIARLEASGQGNDPAIIKAWARVGEAMMGERSIKTTASAPASEGDLDNQISEFREKFKDALYKKEHPDHDRRVREYNRLFQARYPEMGVR